MKYTVKYGDTKSKLRNKFGVGYDYAGYKYKDPNKLDVGEVIEYEPSVNLDTIKTGVTPITIENPESNIQIPQTNLQTPDNTPLQAQNQAIQSDNIQNQLNPLSKEKTALESQIAGLEKKYANTPQDRLQAMEKLGMNDDVQKLNELKTKLGTIKNNLNTLTDREVEIPIEERQKYKDLGINFTTKDISNSTFAERQQNSLDKLATSREYSRLGEGINAYQRTIETNQKQIDDFYTAKKEQINFEYKIKNDRLKAVESAYSDIITNEQQRKLQERKYQLEREQEVFKAKLDLDKENAKLISAGGSGAMDIQNYLSGGVNDKKQVILNGIANGTIKKLDGLKQIDKLNEAYRDDVDKADAMISKGQTVITAIDELFANPRAFELILGFSDWLPNLPGTTKAIASDNWDLIKSLATLDKTSFLKGAMSDKDIELLKQAATLISKNKPLERNMELLSDMKMRFKSAIIKANSLKEKTKSKIVDTEALLKEIESGVPDVISQSEGFSNKAYQDSTGKWTIGYGTTNINGRPVKKGDYISREEAARIAAKQIKDNYSTFKTKINRRLTKNQMDALTSFEYNLGSKGAWGSKAGQSILNDINNGRFEEAGRKMLAFSKALNPQTGVLETNMGLLNRRKKEAQMLLT